MNAIIYFFVLDWNKNDTFLVMKCLRLRIVFYSWQKLDIIEWYFQVNWTSILFLSVFWINIYSCTFAKNNLWNLPNISCADFEQNYTTLWIWMSSGWDCEHVPLPVSILHWSRRPYLVKGYTPGSVHSKSITPHSKQHE